MVSSNKFWFPCGVAVALASFMSIASALPAPLLASAPVASPVVSPAANGPHVHDFFVYSLGFDHEGCSFPANYLNVQKKTNECISTGTGFDYRMDCIDGRAVAQECNTQSSSSSLTFSPFLFPPICTNNTDEYQGDYSDLSQQCTLDVEPIFENSGIGAGGQVYYSSYYDKPGCNEEDMIQMSASAMPSPEFEPDSPISMRYQCHDGQLSVAYWSSSEETFPVGVSGGFEAPTCFSNKTYSAYSACGWETPAETFADIKKFKFPTENVLTFVSDPDAQFALIDNYGSKTCSDKSFEGTYVPIVGPDSCIQPPGANPHRYVITSSGNLTFTVGTGKSCSDFGNPYKVFEIAPGACTPMTLSHGKSFIKFRTAVPQTAQKVLESEMKPYQNLAKTFEVETVNPETYVVTGAYFGVILPDEANCHQGDSDDESYELTICLQGRLVRKYFSDSMCKKVVGILAIEYFDSSKMNSFCVPATPPAPSKKPTKKPTFKPTPGKPSFKPTPGKPSFKPSAAKPNSKPSAAKPSFKPTPGKPTTKPSKKAN